MSDQDFLFALDVSGDSASDQMLADVARTVLGHVGYPSAAIDALTAELRAALAERFAGKRRVDIQFRCAAGQLEIAVSSAGAADWHSRRPLPAS